MAEPRLRLLFVINQFNQGGSERYLFELCAALDRRLFDVHVLTRTGVDRSAFYYPRITALGVPIHASRPYIPDVRRFAPALAGAKLVRTVRHRLMSWRAHRRLADMLSGFDIVACIQLENFLSLRSALVGHPGAVVHLMSNSFQYPYDPYDELPSDPHYRFVVLDPSQTEELSRFSNAEVFQWPPSMDLTGYPRAPRPTPGGPAKIGIVTRLSREKPLEPLFRSFAELATHIDATLHVYGGGDPSIFADDIRNLKIGDRVTFEGHRTNLLQMVAEEGLSMCWLMAVGTLLGYASIELAATGMPMVFWNFKSDNGAGIVRQAHESCGAVHSFSSTAELAAFTRAQLVDRDRLTSLGERLRQHVMATHDVHRNLPALQSYYLRAGGRPPSADPTR